MPFTRVRDELFVDANGIVEHDVTMLNDNSVTMGIRREGQGAVSEQKNRTTATHPTGTNHLLPYRH